MMHYSGNEDHFFLCHRHPPGAEKRAPEGSSLALAQFPPSHVGCENPQSLSARHGDDDGCSRPLEHAQSLLVSYMLALSGQVGSGRVRSGQVGSGQVHSSIVADNKPLAQTYGLLFIWPSCEMPNAWVMMIYG